jgi:hypothetical protein
MGSAGDSLDAIKLAAEQSLYYLARALLGFKFLLPFPRLHGEFAAFLQDSTHRRKLGLLPRDHAKTTLAKSLVIHACIQPQAHNIYVPDVPGNETRVIYGGETTKNTSRHLQVIEHMIEKQPLLRQLWPWMKPGPKWSQTEMQLERNGNYSEPTCEALGTDTALASRHVDIFIKDDIFTLDAMLSSAIGQRVITWHQISEAVLDDSENRGAWEIVIGTPWAPNDVYRQIKDTELAEDDDPDPTLFHLYQRAIVENDEPIWPERFPMKRILRIKKRLDGTGLFELNYMCDHTGGSLTDLRPEWLRSFKLDPVHRCIVCDATVVLREPNALQRATAFAMGEDDAPMVTVGPVETHTEHKVNRQDIASWLRNTMK